MTWGASERAQVKNEFSNFDKIDTERMSPLYIAISRYVASHPESLDIFETVPDEKRRPMLLFAAVHYLVLKGEGDRLTHIYETAEDRRAIDAAGPAFVEFVSDHSDEIVELLNERAVQTNEVNRCVALLPALMAVHRERRQPLALVEIGAAAGLNLLFDRYRYDYVGGPVIGPPGATVRLSTQLRGRVPRMDAAAPPVEHRVGIDLDPIDVNDDDSVLWLRACVWAGDVARDQRLTAAIALARREWPQVEQRDAVTALPGVIDHISEDLDLCVFSAWMISWLSRDQREQLYETMREIGNNRRIWWISYEESGRVPGMSTPDGADIHSSVLGLQCFGPEGVESRPLALVHAHGAWLDWVDSATAAW